MDLLVVCADAGLSMEAALDRVGRELGMSYPSLSANIHMANLEIRAGRTMTEALEHLGDRLGLDEARSFATLIQQSDELGSSIGDALRVYSTTCATSGCRAPKRSLQPPGQARDPNDGLHLSGAVHRHPLPGHRPAGDGELVTTVIPPRSRRKVGARTVPSRGKSFALTSPPRAPYSITSSARPSSDSGTVSRAPWRPSDLSPCRSRPLHHRQIGGLLAFENPPGIEPDLPVRFGEARARS